MTPQRFATWVLLGTLGSGLTSAEALEGYAGGAVTRGFFPWAAMAGLAATTPVKIDKADLTVRWRGDVAFANRQNVSNGTLAAISELRLQVPGFEGNHFQPFVGTGPGLHFQVSWSDLTRFGGVESRSAWVVKWHAFVGATLARGNSWDLFTEARYSVPSSLHFDFVLVGIQFAE